MSSLNLLPSMNKSTAIILFARTVESESKEKQLLLRNGKANRNALNLLRLHAVEVIKDSKLPYFIFSEEEQIGESFAVKITNAYQQIFDLGFDNVICIGSDTPSITTKDITTATQLLQQKQVVCGPTQCGGSYLLGINKSVFNKKIFSGLAWQTAQLFDDITEGFKDCGIMNELPELNNAAQLSALRFSPLKIIGVAQSLLKLVNSVLFNNIDIVTTYLFSTRRCSLQLQTRAP